MVKSALTMDIFDAGKVNRRLPWEGWPPRLSFILSCKAYYAEISPRRATVTAKNVLGVGVGVRANVI